MTMIVESFDTIYPAKEKDVQKISSIMKKRKRGHWNAQSYQGEDFSLTTVTLYQSYCSIFIYALKYLPTIKCSHCPIIANSSPAVTLESQDQCSACHKIYNIKDQALGEEDTRKFEELQHILQLCFDHRKKLLDNCADSLIKKLLGENASKAKGFCFFVDVRKYGFSFRRTQ